MQIQAHNYCQHTNQRKKDSQFQLNEYNNFAWCFLSMSTFSFSVFYCNSKVFGIDERKREMHTEHSHLTS